MCDPNFLHPQYPKAPNARQPNVPARHNANISDTFLDVANRSEEEIQEMCQHLLEHSELPQSQKPPARRGPVFKPPQGPMSKSDKLRNAIWTAMNVHKSIRRKVQGDIAKFDGYLWEYVDERYGMPNIVWAITAELERQGSTIVDDVYRMRADKEDVRYIKKLFKRTDTPDLRGMHHIPLSQALLSFFKDLAEPVIRPEARDMFLIAGSYPFVADRAEAMVDLLGLLHPVARVTLARIVRHLKKMGNHRTSLVTEMDMAEVWGPILFGYSSCDKKGDREETNQIVNAMYGLMQVPQNEFLSSGCDLV